MFGDREPPGPPPHESLVVLVIAVAIAAVLTLVSCGFFVLVERLRDAG